MLTTLSSTTTEWMSVITGICRPSSVAKAVPRPKMPEQVRLTASQEIRGLSGAASSSRYLRDSAAGKTGELDCQVCLLIGDSVAKLQNCSALNFPR